MQPLDFGLSVTDPHLLDHRLQTVIDIVGHPEPIAAEAIDEMAGDLDSMPTTYRDIVVRVAAVLLKTPSAYGCLQDLKTYLSNSESREQAMARIQAINLAIDSLRGNREFKHESRELGKTVTQHFLDTIALLPQTDHALLTAGPDLAKFRVALIQKGLEAMGA